MLEIMVNILLPLIWIICLFFIIRTGQHTKETLKYFTKLSNRIEHLYTLTKILSEGLCSPMHKLIFAKIFSSDPEKVSPNSPESFEFFREVILDNYQGALEVLTKIKEKAYDPKEKKRLDKNITEIENVINLLSTVDKESSKEHICNIMNEVSVSMRKIAKESDDI